MEPRLLDHPFYQAWNDGTLTEEQLADYHASYAEFVRAFPGYWKRVVTSLACDVPEGMDVVAEEVMHIELWNYWRPDLNPAAPHGLADVCAVYDELPPSELLGAIHAFEIQQPEIARTKREGLLKHYGRKPAQVVYFDAHMREERHIGYAERLARQAADCAGFASGFARGARLLYDSLDRFLRD